LVYVLVGLFSSSAAHDKYNSTL